MTELNRREFLSFTAASLVIVESEGSVSSGSAPKIQRNENYLRVEGSRYTWEWSKENDRFSLFDRKGRRMTTGRLQPAVMVQPVGKQGVRRCTTGRVVAHEVTGNRAAIAYTAVNQSAKVMVAWRFDDEALWLEPVIYETPQSEDIVSLHYFAESASDQARPTLESYYLVVPGISESSAISPIVTSNLGLHFTSWLGRGAFPSPSLMQQWGLPAHYFCGFHPNTPTTSRVGALKEHLSDAYCCGLSEVPAGDLFLEIRGGHHGPLVSFRSDLWGHLRGPGRFSLGSTWHWAVGNNYYEAIRQYYRGMVRAGVVSAKPHSARKNSIALRPQFNTWGAELALNKESERLDQAALELIYKGLKASGMKAGTFVIDDKWEGKYGQLEHSAERLPRFEDFLREVRAEGLKVGLWAAFLRCEDPKALGLNESHMLRQPEGKPFAPGWGTHYYIMDVTQPEVELALRAAAKKFVRRYQPDLVKFDFGYELPSLGTAAPKDMRWAGDRLLQKGLDVVIKAMREEKPDLVVMYYSLSPLFTEYLDLHSPDDLFLCAGEYDLEANRRFFFSSLLGEIGMPTYGSGGYDWRSMPEIWFDSAAIGTLGSLNSFVGDEQGGRPTPALLAKYNGLAHVLRPTNVFTIEPIDTDYIGPVRGARSSSWARMEEGEVVLVALRKNRLDGRKGTGQFRDLIRTGASVVVASKTLEGLSRARKLAIVPYSDGELVIRREDARETYAEVTTHLWGEKTEKTRLPIRDSALRVPLREYLGDGSLVEWLEVEVRQG